MSDNEDNFIDDWNELAIHLDQNKPDLLLLPEMPFCKWIASEKKVSDEVKLDSVQKHDKWTIKIGQLNARSIIYSRPVIAGDKFLNTAYVYNKEKAQQDCF